VHGSDGLPHHSTRRRASTIGAAAGCLMVSYLLSSVIFLFAPNIVCFTIPHLPSGSQMAVWYT